MSRVLAIVDDEWRAVNRLTPLCSESRAVRESVRRACKRLAELELVELAYRRRSSNPWSKDEAVWKTGRPSPDPLTRQSYTDPEQEGRWELVVRRARSTARSA
jgi:hypothetical protein